MKKTIVNKSKIVLEEKNLTIPTGYCCNNFCRFCMESDRKKRYEYVKEFTKDRVYSVLDKNRKMDRVIFGTGEPTLNPDLVDYAEYAKKAGYKKIAVVSNGRRYAHRDFCLELIDAGVTEFIISLHGHERKIHDFLTRSPGSFEQTVSGLANISSFNKRLSKIVVNHVVSKVNYRYVGDFLDFLKQFKINGVNLLVAEPSGEGMEKNFFNLMPKYGNLAKILEKILEDNSRFFPPNSSNKSNKPNHLAIIDFPFCFSENIFPYIGSRKTRFMESDKKVKKVKNLFKKVKRKECAICRHFAICDGVFENYIKNYGWREFKPVE
jgi:cyclic pyranopterin phosphate synthase